MKIEIEKWKSAILSTLFISVLPNILLYLIPMKWLTKGKQDSLNIQHILLCFAAGGLLGDVLLHSLPHLLVPHQHNHNHQNEHEHEHNYNSESRGLFHYEEHEHEHEHENHHHEHDHEEHDHDHHDHEHEHEHKLNSIINENHNHEHEHDSSHEHLMYIGLLVIIGYLIFFLSERLLSLQLNTNSNESEKKRKDGTKQSNSHHAHNHNHSHGISSNITVMGWLNIIADLMHNFTDGIAMGASYATNSSTTLGLAATMSILFHEIPHEIGDFTVLIESGVSKSEAIKVQFITSIAAFIGTIIGLMSNGAGVWNEVLLGITSGGFIYVSTSSLIPSILNKGPESTTSSPYLQILLECLGFLAGVGAMYIVGFLE